MYLFAGFLNLTLCMTIETQGPGAVFFLLYTDNSNVKAKEIATPKENSKNVLELFMVSI
jgi:hypothetical protein